MSNPFSAQMAGVTFMGLRSRKYPPWWLILISATNLLTVYRDTSKSLLRLCDKGEERELHSWNGKENQHRCVAKRRKCVSYWEKASWSRWSWEWWHPITMQTFPKPIKHLTATEVFTKDMESTRSPEQKDSGPPCTPTRTSLWNHNTHCYSFIWILRSRWCLPSCWSQNMLRCYPVWFW